MRMKKGCVKKLKSLFRTSSLRKIATNAIEESDSGQNFGTGGKYSKSQITLKNSIKAYATRRQIKKTGGRRDLVTFP